MYRKQKLDYPLYCLNSTLIVIVLPRLVSKWVSSLIYLVFTLSQSRVQGTSTPYSELLILRSIIQIVPFALSSASTMLLFLLPIEDVSFSVCVWVCVGVRASNVSRRCACIEKVQSKQTKTIWCEDLISIKHQWNSNQPWSAVENKKQ